jgi:pyrophosphatase PpaX
MMDRGLKFIGADEYIEVAIGYDSVHIHKPDPYPVRAALELLDYQASEAVFVGDSPHDIKSGNDAGVITIAALWGPFRREQLEPYNPAYFLGTIKELPQLLDRIATKKRGSPSI